MAAPTNGCRRPMAACCTSARDSRAAMRRSMARTTRSAGIAPSCGSLSSHGWTRPEYKEGVVNSIQPDQVRRVGVVGAGVIGGGWALHYLRMGLDVDVYDPAPGAQRDLLRVLDETWPLLERMGLRAGAGPDRLSFHADLAAAVSGAVLVPANSPEDGPVKRGVLAAIDRAARPDAVIASSTSGFAMTMLQADCARPERCVVGHPFNPPYLIPLVEVVGGERTDPAAVDWLAAVYTAMGMRPLRLSRELPRFGRNPLPEAMWRGGG